MRRSPCCGGGDLSRRELLVAAVLAILTWLVWRGLRPTQAELRFLSVGQGDCALYQDSSLSLLIDAGPSDEAAQRLILPRLRRLGVRHLSIIVITHPDSDHIGGLPTLWRRFPEARVVANGAFRDHPVMVAKAAEAGRSLSDIVWIRSRSIVESEEAQIEVWTPPDDGLGSDNSGSLFTRIQRGKSLAVLTGDAPQSTEEAMAPRGDFAAQVANSGHHGSAGSLGLTWLAEVRPKWVVASCGRVNPFGHPTPEATERALRAGAEFLRTDRDGEVVFVASPNGFVRGR